MPVGLTRSLLKLTRNRPSIEEIDTSLAPDSDRDGILEGPRHALTIAQNAAADFTRQYSRGLDSLLLDAAEQQALRTLIGKGGMPARLLLSCVPTRLELTARLIEQFRKHWHNHRGEPGRRYMFITIITDSGNTLARRPHIDLQALRRRVDKLLRPLSLDVVFMLEVQLLTNFPRFGDGGSHQWHAHCIATIDDDSFNCRAAEALLRTSARLSNVFGAPTVKITPIKTLAHLMRCCAYMLKPPAIGKRLMPHPKMPSAWTFAKVFVRPDEALRLGEAISQVDAGQALHSINGGKFILRPVMKAVRHWHKLKFCRARRKLDQNCDVATLWEKARRGRSRDLNEPYNVEPSRSPQYSWEEVARSALSRMNGPVPVSSASTSLSDF